MEHMVTLWNRIKGRIQDYLIGVTNCRGFVLLDTQACANSVDPDRTPQNVASDQGLHYLPLIQQFLDSWNGHFHFLGEVW